MARATLRHVLFARAAITAAEQEGDDAKSNKYACDHRSLPSRSPPTIRLGQEHNHHKEDADSNRRP